ncbi:Lactamase-B domain-containing protein [Fusarium keratoplasticum]|uniref:Lactamase-B domain-containing protein n=1 Tax=Fusarium keratoplasticum TaxID=1328300 RepID=A0ACC0QU06_9HYPO|nr:Lactamase-B domain-containing protein [Fusarium keratoplasticum]KAI8663748.1 Lactamase-B domain-containing protein [Fusarium keratoplasticum]
MSVTSSAAKQPLVEVDSLEIHVLVNDEIDQISPSPNPRVQHTQSFAGVPLSRVPDPTARGGANWEMPMRNICCGAHGLSLFITATKDGRSRTLLFDAGPEEDIFEKNAERLRLQMSGVEVIALSHWHRDHSGGLLSAIRLINGGKADDASVVVALPPDRPDYRGAMFDEPVSLEPDPTLEEIQRAGGKVETVNHAGTVLDGMFLVSGDIPRRTAYEGGIPGGIRYDSTTKKWTPDELIMEERFVMCKLKGKGLVIFTGCSHAGLINIAKNARELDESPIYSIVGGYHLADASPEKMDQSIKDLKELEPALLMPGHCTGWRFKGLVEKEMPGQMVPIFGGTKYTL